MKSVLVVGQQENLFALIADHLAVQHGATVRGEHAQLVLDGANALFYPYPGDDWREPPVTGLGSSYSTAVMLECRREPVVVSLFQDLSTVIEGLLLVDGDDRVWDAASIDVGQLLL